jgi:hypothetical protein
MTAFSCTDGCISWSSFSLHATSPVGMFGLNFKNIIEPIVVHVLSVNEKPRLYAIADTSVIINEITRRLEAFDRLFHNSTRRR